MWAVKVQYTVGILQPTITGPTECVLPSTVETHAFWANRSGSVRKVLLNYCFNTVNKPTESQILKRAKSDYAKIAQLEPNKVYRLADYGQFVEAPI